MKGYYVGGKTGTSEKVVDGRYSKTKLLNTFTAILPADKPRYLLLIMLDEPQAAAGNARLCHLGLERRADRRPGDRPHRADARHRAALRPAAGRHSLFWPRSGSELDASGLVMPRESGASSKRS